MSEFASRLRRFLTGGRPPFAALTGPVERVGEQFILRIPLKPWGHRLIECTRTIAEVQGKLLVIRIPARLAETTNLREGEIVEVNNAHGQFHLGVER